MLIFHIIKNIVLVFIRQSYMSAIFFVWYNAIIFSLLQSFIFFFFFYDQKPKLQKKNVSLLIKICK